MEEPMNPNAEEQSSDASLDDAISTDRATEGHTKYNRIFALVYHVFDYQVKAQILTAIYSDGDDPMRDVGRHVKRTMLSGLIVLIIAALAWWRAPAPHNVPPAFWIAGVSLNVAVAAGLLAFAPWLPERLPEIATTLLNEAVDAGVIEWKDGLDAKSAYERYKESSMHRRTMLSISMTRSGIALLLASLASFPLMLWLSTKWEIALVTGLVATTVAVLFNIAVSLLGLEMWALMWRAFKLLADWHSHLEACPQCPQTTPGQV